jgi:hypothetical protein
VLILNTCHYGVDIEYLVCIIEKHEQKLKLVFHILPLYPLVN